MKVKRNPNSGQFKPGNMAYAHNLRANAELAHLLGMMAPNAPRCQVIARHSGKRCRNLACKGRRACRMHGGAFDRPAPNAWAERRRALARIACIAPEALRRQPAFKAARGVVTRAALVQAWQSGDPAAWRRAIADL